MHFEGKFEVKAPAQRVWSFIIDPRSFSKCFPGLQELEVLDERRFKARVKAGVSFIKGEFNVQSTIMESSPPKHARMIVRGSGIGTSVDMDTTIDLEEVGAGTTAMVWKAEVTFAGLLAGVGSRLVAAATDKIQRELFECVRSHVER